MKRPEKEKIKALILRTLGSNSTVEEIWFRPSDDSFRAYKKDIEKILLVHGKIQDGYATFSTGENPENDVEGAVQSMLDTWAEEGYECIASAI